MIRQFPAIVLGVACLAFGWAIVHGDSKSQKEPPEAEESALMMAKLGSTQRIVEGLVSKDFSSIHKGAKELIKICKAGEWRAHQDDVYGHYRRELSLQAEKLMIAAERENIDAAAYAYIQSLTTCISCHDYCRDVLKIADANSVRVVPIPTTEEATVPRSIRR